MKRFVLLVAPMLLAATADAQTFGDLAVTGTACEPNAARIIDSGFAPTIAFEDFDVAAGGANAPFFRGMCNVAIPVDVPPGMSIAVAGQGYRIEASLPVGTGVVLSVEGFLAGQVGPVTARSLSGPQTGTFVGASVIPRQERQWSACG